MMDVAIKYKNYKNYLSLSNEFHNIYRDKCDNQVLLNVLNPLVYNFMPKAYTSDDEEELFKMIAYSNIEHLRLVNAFKEKNDKEVENIIKKHWSTIPINEMKIREA